MEIEKLEGLVVEELKVVGEEPFQLVGEEGRNHCEAATRTRVAHNNERSRRDIGKVRKERAKRVDGGRSRARTRRAEGSMAWW